MQPGDKNSIYEVRTMAKEIVFIDARVENPQDITAKLSPDVEVIRINADGRHSTNCPGASRAPEY